ncbi:MAG: OadG family protein [Anaerolineae bacterium]|jgi:sodium pump decarboxylase gamma subunit|nr:OadG family protein [Anaerolineae bacterium]
MSDLLRQALWYTVIGMGITFLSLGALAVGMYVLTALPTGKKKAEEPPTEVAAPQADDRYLAAAAAVSVALAQAQVIRPTARATSNPWSAYVRSYHLAQRSQHMQPRLRSR